MVSIVCEPTSRVSKAHEPVETRTDLVEFTGGHDVQGEGDILGLKVLFRLVGVDGRDVLVGHEEDPAPRLVDAFEVGVRGGEDVVDHDERVVELLVAFDLEPVLGHGDRGGHVGSFERAHLGWRLVGKRTKESEEERVEDGIGDANGLLL